MKYAYKLAYFGKETYTDINSKPFITKHPKRFQPERRRGRLPSPLFLKRVPLMMSSTQKVITIIPGVNHSQKRLSQPSLPFSYSKSNARRIMATTRIKRRIQ